MIGSIAIRGQGVAAYTCAQLLRSAGMSVSLEETGRARLPAILLGGTTQKLLVDVFGEMDWLRDLPRIDKRIVSWGTDARPVTVPHFARVISEETLARHLRPPAFAPETGDAAWTFIASKPLPAASIEHHFGARRAAAIAVDLQPGSDRSACWLESLESGWLFMIPGGDRSGWLLAVGGPPAELLAASRLIAPQIEAPKTAGGLFPAYPRIADPLCGPGWLCGGTAALAFDPLCGDGTGHAIREAILASAVIRAAAANADADALLAHYRGRILAAFQRHLELCRHFYSTGGSGPWWQSELALIQDGIDWCASQFAGNAGFQFQLNGFDLHPVRPRSRIE